MVNDISIITGIILIFLTLGAIMPYINDSFSITSEEINIEKFEDDIAVDIEDESRISAFTVIFSIFKMFFWTFGSIPFWFDLTIMLTLRIILILTIARNIWIGGGG